MDKDIIEMMEKFNENLKKAKELKEVSNPEITENAEDNIQNLTSEQLKLKMRIERAEASLEEYKTEDDYLSKSEYQRKISEKEYTDRIDELKEEETKAAEKLENAKSEVEKQRKLEEDTEKLVNKMKEVGTAKNIRQVKEAISKNEDETEQVKLDYKIMLGRYDEKIEAVELNIRQIEKSRDRLRNEPSWDQAKYDEYTEKIESLKNGIGLLENQKQAKEIERDNKVADLADTKVKYEEFLNNIENIFYGKDILGDKQEEAEIKEQPKNEPEKNNETASSERNEESHNTDENNTVKPSYTQAKNTEHTTDTETKSMPENTQEQTQSTNTKPKTVKTEKTVSTNQEQVIDAKPEETENKEKSGYKVNEIIKPEIKISAKDDCVYIDGKRIDNLGIAQSFNNKKELFKKANVNQMIKKTINSSSLLKKIFVDPINKARIKAKIDPTIINMLSRQEENIKEGTSIKISEKVGMDIQEYIESLNSKEELAVSLVYDLKQSRFDNKDFKNLENKLQNYARYANEITGVKVEGLKPKKNLMQRLLGSLTVGGVLEAGKDQETKNNTEFKESVKLTDKERENLVQQRIENVNKEIPKPARQQEDEGR